MSFERAAAGEALAPCLHRAGGFVGLGGFPALAHAGDVTYGEVSPDESSARPADDGTTGAEATAAGEPAVRQPLFDQGRLNAQWFWAKDKAMPGIGLSASHRFVDLDFEVSLLWSTREAEGYDGSFLGSQFGIFLSLVPLRSRQGALGIGLGGDLHYLGGIHKDLVEGAFAPRAFARLALMEDLALLATARVYLLETSGLDLGAERDGSSGLPVLFSTGVSWRLP